MRNVTDLTDARVEPDIIMMGPAEPVVPGTPDHGPPARRRRSAEGARGLRRFAEPGLVVVAAAAMVLAGQVTGGGGSPVAEPAAPSVSPAAASFASPRASASLPRFVAPRAASAGQWITVLAYRNPRLCGPAELRFDGALVAHRLGSYVGQQDSDRVDMFLTMQVPRSARRGIHEIELYGPISGGGSNPLCADVPEHQGQLATATVTVGTGETMP
jgi:hypothetical protein